MDASLYSRLTQGATLITASHHLAHSLKTEYAIAARAQGKLAWTTPRVVTWTSFIRQACQQVGQSLSPPLRMLSEHQAAAVWERIVNEANDRDQVIDNKLLNPTQAARDAQRSWNLLHQYRLPVERLAAYDYQEAKVFLAWAKRFIQQTTGQHWLDSARFTQCLIEHRYTPSTDLLLYGFDDIKPDMQQLLTHWQEQGVAIEPINSPTKHSSLKVIAVNNEQEELKQAALWARHQVELGIQRVAVVVPQLSTKAAVVRRQFAEVFSPSQRRIDAQSHTDAFTLAVTTPLLNYLLVQHALLCLQIITTPSDVLSIGRLLRSPFFKGYEQESSLRALLDSQLRTDRREQWQVSQLQRVSAEHGCVQLAAGLQAAIDKFAQQSNRQSVSDWADVFLQVLKSAGWAQGRTLQSDEHQTLNKFYDVLAELGSLDDMLGEVSSKKALATLRALCSRVSFSPESTDQPVTIIDPDVMTGMTFDALWLMGLQANTWPPMLEPDPFIPVELQRQANMIEAVPEVCLSQAKQKLQRLSCSANTVVFSWPQHEADAELRRSPLLNDYPADEQQPLPSAPVMSLAEHLFQQRPVLESWQDPSLPPLTTSETKGGTRILELQSRCPFRAQVELRLHARRIEDIVVGLSPADRGKVVHRVLDDVWGELKNQKTLLNIDLQTYELSVRQMTQRHAQQVFKAQELHKQHLVDIEVDFLTRWIMDLLELEKERSEFNVYQAEDDQVFNLAGLSMSIRPDRVDALPDGSRVLIDYKTSNTNDVAHWFDEQPNRPSSPQLPAYALAHSTQAHVAGITFAVLSPDAVAMRGLADRDIGQGIANYELISESKKQMELKTWPEVMMYWQQSLTSLAEQYQAGNAALTPLKKACDYCHLTGLCRINEFKQVAKAESEDEDGEDANG